MKQKYKQRIAYLYKKKPYIKGEDKPLTDSEMFNTEPTPFYCSMFEQSRSIAVPMSNSYRTVTETVIRTTEQLNFEEHDRIAFVKVPQNNVNQQDFNSIVSAIRKPILQKGMKYRNKDYYEWEIRVS